MTGHDPLCHAAAFKYHDPECCDCDLIAKVRADERTSRKAASDALVRSLMLADLRAQVAELITPPTPGMIEWRDGWNHAVLAVLALIDGDTP